jgi:hypothetical protein
MDLLRVGVGFTGLAIAASMSCWFTARLFLRGRIR